MSDEIQNENLEITSVPQQVIDMKKEIDDFFDIYFKNEAFKESALEDFEF